MPAFARTQENEEDSSEQRHFQDTVLSEKNQSAKWRGCYFLCNKEEIIGKSMYLAYFCKGSTGRVNQNICGWGE